MRDLSVPLYIIFQNNIPVPTKDKRPMRIGDIQKIRTHRNWTVHCLGCLSKPVWIKSAWAPTGSLGSRQKQPGN